jgi:hypothetical protein
MSAVQDPWNGVRPQRPPAELRARVLGAAREAATRRGTDLFTALYHDHLLRLCAATLAALLLVDAIVFGGGATHVASAPYVDAGDGVVVPAEGGFTAAEQLDDLAPVVGAALARSRG